MASAPASSSNMFKFLTCVTVFVLGATGSFLPRPPAYHLQYDISSIPKDLYYQAPWFHRDAESCLESLGDRAIPPQDGGVYCDALWDHVLCWPVTPAGYTIHQHCPPLRGLDPRNFANRRCGMDGEWLGRRSGDWSPTGWTNYTMCYTPAALALYQQMIAKS